MPKTQAPRRRFIADVCVLALTVSALAACSNGAAPSTVSTASAGNAPEGKPAPKPPSSSALFALLPPSIRSSKVLRVAANAPFPPFEMFTSAGGTQFTGFEYDLGQAIGQELGIKVTFAQTAFDGLIPSLQAGKSDAIMAGLSVNAAREQVVTFIPYFKDGTGILVAKGNPDHISSVLGLCGKTAAVQTGSVQVPFLASQQSACASAGKPHITVEALPQFSDAQLAVTSGKAVAAVSDEAILAYAAKAVDNGQEFEIVNVPAEPGGYNTQPGGIAILKSDTQLITAVQNALQELMNDGIYKALLAKYGLTAIAIQSAQIDK